VYSGLTAPLPTMTMAMDRPQALLTTPEIEKREMFVCAGKEWYRFPSHFLLPHGMKFKFIQSRFNGLLPHSFGNQSDSEPIKIRNGIFEYSQMVKLRPRMYSYSIENVNDKNRFEKDRVVGF
jgi:alpha-1,2-mannosyltransferase